MPNSHTKPSENLFRNARIELSVYIDKFKSMDGAAEEMRIDRGRLQKIETDATNPHPEEVVIMADTYKKPELGNYYCANICPVGKNSVPYTERLELDRVTLAYISTVRQADDIVSDMIAIAGDGHISDDELPVAGKIREVLRKRNAATEAYLLMLEKRLSE